MRILFICQYYYPEPFRHPDFCEELVRNGHEVTVVTGVPNYPMGQIYEEYKNGNKRDEVINGVKVHRCFTIGRRHNMIFRFLNYYSFTISSTKYIRTLKDDYDIVLVHQLSPVMMAAAGIEYKKLHNKRLLLYCLDLWPESLITGGIKKGCFIYKIFLKISKNIYSKADKIFVSSKPFIKYFKEKFDIDNVEYLPQYSRDIFTPETCKKQENGYIDLMFAGNTGKAQSVSTIIEAARLTQDIENLRWHIVGDGHDYEDLKQSAKNLPNVFFYGRKGVDEMPKYYAMADAMLITTKKTDVYMTLPGKVQTYMAAGKPIIGAINGEGQAIINEANCGLCGNSQDPESLANNARHFINMDKEQLGKNARKYYEEHYTKERFMQRAEEEILYE